MSEETPPVARMEAAGRNPGNAGETGTPDSAAQHPGYGAMPHEGWACRRIGEIFEIGSGEAAAYRSNDFSGPVVVYGANGPIGSYDESNFGPGYLIGRVGAAGFVNRVPVKVWASDNTLTLAPVTNKCDPDFAGFLLELIDPRSLATKTAQPLVTQTGLANLEAFIPTQIEEQRRIAEILDTLDDAIRKTEQLINKLKQIRQGLLHDLLTRGIDENGQLRDPIAHPEQFKDSVAGRIPNSWDLGRLDAFVYIHDRKRIPLKQSDRDNMKGIYPYYGASGIIDYISDYIFDGEYILLGEDGENVVSRNLPLAFRASGKFWVNNHAHVFEPKDGMDVRYLEELMEFTDYSRIVLGSAQPKITQEGLSRLWFDLPPSEEQSRIADVLATHTKRVNEERNYLAKLTKLKKGLMTDLLAGQVRVRIGA